MAEKPTIKSATARFIKKQKVFFKTHLNFQNTTIVIVLTTMIIKDSTAKITVQKINSSALHVIVLMASPVKEKNQFFIIERQKFNTPSSLTEDLIYQL